MVTAWRERERLLRKRGADLTLVAAARWEEGGSMVAFTPAGDDFAVPVRTLGRHPNLFLYDPRPLWRLLGSTAVGISSTCTRSRSAWPWPRCWSCGGCGSSRTPFVVSSAQNIDKRYPPPFRWFERWSLRRAAGAYTCNTEAGEILRAQGSRGASWCSCRSAWTSTGSIPPDRRRPRGRLRVGFVGRLIPHKGVDVLLDAVALDDRLDADIFGAGPELDRLVAAGRHARPRRSGHLPRPRRRSRRSPASIRRFDVLAVPSVPTPGWLEQFGRVVVEAQASGVPVVASASGALPDVVGEAGLLVPAGDPGALCARPWAGSSTSPGLWERLRSAGIAAVDRVLVGRASPTPSMALYRPASSRTAAGSTTVRPGTVAGHGPGCTRLIDLTVERLEPVDVVGQREQLLLALAERGPRPGAAGPGSSASRDQGRGRRRRVAGREEEPVVAHRLEVGAAPGRHHGHPVGHRLDHRQPEGLGRRRGQEDRRPGQQVVGVGHLTEELDAVGHAEVVGQLDQRGPQRTAAGDHQAPPPVAQPARRPGPDADVGGLLGVEPLEHDTTGWSIQRGLGPIGDPVGDERRMAYRMLSATNSADGDVAGDGRGW